MNILIVEDDPLIGPAMKAVLTNAGHGVAGPVRTAAKAIRRVEQERPDLALVDFFLSGGENGLTLVHTLRQRYGVPSLLVTGFEHRAEDVRGAALGLLRKPFPPDALTASVRVVERLLAGAPPAPLPATLMLFASPLAEVDALRCA